MIGWGTFRNLGCVLAVAATPICRAQTLPRTIDWCEVVERPGAFDGKDIEVRGAYRTRFETSELYCLGCKAGGSAWVDFHKAIPFPAPLHGMQTGTANVIFAGSFRSAGGPFGHLGGYKFLFEVTAVKKAQKIEASGFPAAELPPEVASLVCGAITASILKQTPPD